jgi:hypothetical protein
MSPTVNITESVMGVTSAAGTGHLSRAHDPSLNRSCKSKNDRQDNN